MSGPKLISWPSLAKQKEIRNENYRFLGISIKRWDNQINKSQGESHEENYDY